jgi:N6-adenosine-specific RNA methylase IME4
MPVMRRKGAGPADCGDNRDSKAPPQNPQAGATRRISDVTIGVRHRRDLGDIEGLAANIAEVGLLHPIVVTPGNVLITGERRLAAVKTLGWDTVPVTVVDLDAIVQGEFAENSQRKDFTLSESVAIKRAIEPIERAEAKKRQATAGPASGRGKKNATGSGKLPTPVRGRAADKAAQATGKARRTLEKAGAIVAAAEAEPERFGKLLADMDRTGRVNGPFKRLRVAQQAAAIRAESPPLPGRGPYRVIVADPPWPYDVDTPDPRDRATYSYPQMSIAQIAALDVASIEAPDCILWLWITNFHMLNSARAVLDAWGFKPITILTWAKDQFGRGTWLHGQTEHCIFATRGKPTVELTTESTLLNAPVRAHSEKPAEFYALVERLCPAPRYAELFSRRRYSDRWDCHGDQAPAAERCDDFAIPEFLRRAMNHRARLANRRASTTFAFSCNDLKYIATISRYEDGRLAEIFIGNAKAGSHSDAAAKDAAVVCSIALQYSVPIEVIRKALLRDSGGGASSPLGCALDHIVAADSGMP